MTTTLVETEPKQPLILTGDGYGLTIAPEYETKKLELLKNAALIVIVNDAVGDAAADSQIRLLAAMRIAVEKSREIAKRPALDFGKNVDAKARDFVTAIDAEETRLKKARGTYAEAVIKERTRVLAEMEKARHEEARRVREAEDKRRAEAAAAEKARIEAEENAWNATTPEEEAEAARLAAEAAAAKAERLRIAAEEASRIAALPVAAPAFVPEAPKGVKMVPDYELTDILALLHHNAGLVTLTERRKEILEAIARGMIGDVPPQIPGLRVFMRPQVR